MAFVSGHNLETQPAQLRSEHRLCAAARTCPQSYKAPFWRWGLRVKLLVWGRFVLPRESRAEERFCSPWTPDREQKQGQFKDCIWFSLSHISLVLFPNAAVLRYQLKYLELCLQHSTKVLKLQLMLSVPPISIWWHKPGRHFFLVPFVTSQWVDSQKHTLSTSQKR